MSRSVMLDIETLGTAQNAVILSLGAVKFNPYSEKEPHSPFYVKIDVDEQLTTGRTVDEDTLSWWEKQPLHVREEALSEKDRVSVVTFIETFSKYLVGVDTIFAQGPTFDIVLIKDIFRSYGYPVPWNYWQVRDSRTLFDLNPSIKPKSDDLHNALADAYYQAVGVQKLYKHFGVKE